MATKSLIFILSQMRHLKKCIEDKLSSLLPILNFITSRFCKKKRSKNTKKNWFLQITQLKPRKKKLKKSRKKRRPKSTLPADFEDDDEENQKKSPKSKRSKRKLKKTKALESFEDPRVNEYDQLWILLRINQLLSLWQMSKDKIAISYLVAVAAPPSSIDGVFRPARRLVFTGAL